MRGMCGARIANVERVGGSPMGDVAEGGGGGEGHLKVGDLRVLWKPVAGWGSPGPCVCSASGKIARPKQASCPGPLVIIPPV